MFVLPIFCAFHLCFLAFAHAAAGAGLRFKNADNWPYAEYETWDFTSNGTMSFLFQTEKRTALLLYHDNKRNDRGQDYMDVFIFKGKIRLRFNFGFCKQTSELTVDGNFSDSRWHYAVITLDFEYVSISVDKTFVSKRVECETPKYMDEFVKLRRRRWASVYLGGLPARLDWSSVNIMDDAFNLASRFEGCIGNLVFKKGNQEAFKAKIRKKEHVVPECANACKDDLKSARPCWNNGRCIDHIVTYECDCTGTGYEGDDCKNETPMVYMNGSGYIAYRILTPNLKWSMKNNRFSFRIVPLYPNGVILYMGKPADHLVVEMFEGTLLVNINLGGGRLVMRSNVTLNLTEYHYVDITRQERKVTLDINMGWYVQHGDTPDGFNSLDLEDEERVAYFGGGPDPKAIPLSASKRNFSGFLQELTFDTIKVLDKFIYHYDPKDESGRNYSAVGEVLDGRLKTVLLPSNSKIQVGSGCDELDDDEDSDRLCAQPTRCLTPECIFGRATPDISPPPETSPTTMTLPGRLTYGTPSGGVVMSRREAPPDHRVSPWIIIIIVAAAVIAVIITIFLLYRWNNRYTGSFKPSKGGEPTGEGAQPVARGYEQPAFYVSPNKPTKGETVA